VVPFVDIGWVPKVKSNNVDLVLSISASLYDNGTPQQKLAIDWLNDNLKHSSGMLCDTYVLMRYRKGHPLYQEGVFMRAYWMKQWGFDRSEGLKSIAVVKL